MNDGRSATALAGAPVRGHPHGRRSDGPRAMVRRALRGTSRAPAVVLGQQMLLASGAVLLLTTPLLSPTARDWRWIGVVSVVMVAALLASLRVPWRRLPLQAALVLPVLALVALTFLGAEAAPYAGFWILAFTVTGLTQSARTNWLALVPAVPTYVLTVGTFTAGFGVRAIITVSVWMLVAQLLVRMTRRQRELAGTCGPRPTPTPSPASPTAATSTTACWGSPRATRWSSATSTTSRP